jgi:CO/xanthine dehydrogenase Mo-binding subunit
MVTQDGHLFHDSIRGNLLLARPQATEEELWTALRRSRLEALVAALGWKAGRPVKLALTRAEEFVTTTKHEARVRIKTGLKRDGTIVAREVEIHYNGGAYADRSGTIARSGAIGSTGPYRIPHVKVDAYAVYTNRPNAVPFRGLAVSQVAWAYECHTDELARRLGRDPLELRYQNLLVDGDRFATGEAMGDLHFHALLGDVAAATGAPASLRALVASRFRHARGDLYLRQSEYGSSTLNTSDASDRFERPLTR